jgi:hypothetical protein
MSFHRRHRRRIRRSAVALACCALIAPSAASAGKIGDTPADFGQPVVAPAAKIGDTPAEFGRPVPPAPKGGDTPSDFPGASRAPQYEPTHTVSIVRPERTVVRDVDELLPILLSSGALLLALAGVGIVLMRTGVAPRGVRTH